jgi:hypothetical protein
MFIVPMTYPRFSVILFSLLLFVSSTFAARRERVQFNRIASSVTSTRVTISDRESQRIERFLTAVFPVRPMKRLEHTSEPPVTRRATYTVMEQDGDRFVLVGYTAQWKVSVNVFAMYRIEGGSPNQVWRSRAWEANYDQLSFQTATIGKRNIVLFQEGGGAGEFGLASVFTFQNAQHGVVINDLTPSLPWVWARTHFPFRPLYGASVALKLEALNSNTLTLTASDQSFQVGLVNATRLERIWKYVPKRNRFEHAKEHRIRPSQLTHIGD